jgi:hypothetical protein
LEDRAEIVSPVGCDGKTHEPCFWNVFCNLLNAKLLVYSIQHDGDVASAWIMMREESLIHEKIGLGLDEGIAQHYVVEHVAPYLR